MKKIIMTIVALTLITMQLPAAMLDNYLKNPMVEEGMQYWRHLGKQGNIKNIKGGGIDGSDCLELTGGRLYQKIRHYSDFLDLSDRHYTFSIMAKGKGRVTLGLGMRVVTPGNKKTWITPEWGKPVELNSNWQQITFKHQNKGKYTEIPMVLVKYDGDSRALIDNARFNCDKATIDMALSPVFYVATPGETVKTKISLTKNSKAMPDIALKTELFEPIQGYHCIFQESDLKSSRNGTLEYSFKVPLKNYQNGVRLSVIAPQDGLKKNLFVPVYTPEKVTKMKTAAKAIKLKNNLHILYLGDSLTDMNRGNNYTDIVYYYLNMYNPGKASFKNAGVGGDYIGRTWDRLKWISGKNRPSWRQYMYKDLLTQKPDIIFIMLGGNDTKASSKYDYKRPVSSPEYQYRLYKKMIQYLRKNCDAKLVFISCPSFYFPTQKARADKMSKLKRAHSLFGMDQHIANFNNTLQKLAKEEHIDYIDIYSTTKNHPQKATLFVPEDGVHLSMTGQQVLAEAILKYLKTIY